MEYKLKNLPKSQIEIEITISKEKMDEYYEKACEQLSKEVEVKGFRLGHIPKDVLEKHLDKKHITAHAQELAMKSSYAEVVVKEKIEVISRPHVDIKKEEPFTFTALVAILPEVKLGNYKNIKIDKKDIEVTEKEVEAVLTDLKRYGTTYKEVDREAKKTDRVEIDFEGFDEKEVPVPNTKSSNHPVVIGEGSLIPGFEENLLGLKKAEKKEFNLTFPKDYHKKDFQNKKMKFKVEMKMVEEPIIPELTEEFIEKMTGKKQNLDTLKADIKHNLHHKKEDENQSKRESEYLEKLLKMVEVQIPDALLDEEVEFMTREFKEDLASRGIPFEKFLEQTKTTPEDLAKKYRPEAEKRIKVRLGLRKIIEDEKIEATEPEIKNEYETMKKYSDEKDHKKLEEAYQKGSLKNQLANRIVLGKFFEKVLS